MPNCRCREMFCELVLPPSGPRHRLPAPPSGFRPIGRGWSKKGKRLPFARLISFPSLPHSLTLVGPSTRHGRTETANRNRPHVQARRGRHRRVLRDLGRFYLLNNYRLCSQDLFAPACFAPIPRVNCSHLVVSCHDTIFRTRCIAPPMPTSRKSSKPT